MFFRKLRHAIKDQHAKLTGKLKQIQTTAKGLSGQLSDIRRTVKYMESQLTQRGLITPRPDDSPLDPSSPATPTSLNQYGVQYDAELTSLLVELITQETRTIVEYGTGASTRMLCDTIEKLLPKSCQEELVLLSIDHTKSWQRRHSQALPWKSYLHLRHYDLPGRCRGNDDAGVSYTTAPEQLKRPLDLVYVDGRNRVQCILFASLHLAPDGVIVLDDSRRERYRYARHFFHEVSERGRFTIFKRPIVPTPPKPLHGGSETKVIIQVAFGDKAKRELALGGPTVKCYATRIGADYLAVDETHFPEVPAAEFAKFVCHNLVQKYDRAMIMDCDIVVRENAPDIFQIVPADHLGAVFESEHLDRREWVQEVEELFEISPQTTRGRYFNSGILVMGRNSYALFDDKVEETMFRAPQYEQAYLNARVWKLGIPLYPLEKDFNYLSSFDPGHLPDWRYAWFIHLAGSWLHGPMHSSKYWENSSSHGNIVSYARKDLIGSRCRLVRMEHLNRSLAEEREIRVYTSANFIQPDKNRIKSSPSTGEAVTDLGRSSQDTLLLQGPEAEIAPGNYLARILTVPEDGKPTTSVTVQVTADGVPVFHRQEISIQHGEGQFLFEIKKAAEKLCFQIYGSPAKSLLFKAAVVEPHPAA